MAYKVNFSVPTRELGKTDIIVTVNQETKGKSQKLGDLTISKGAVEWTPAHGKKLGKRIPWAKLAKLIEDSK